MATGQSLLLLVGLIAILALILGFWQLSVSRKLGCELRELRQQLVAVGAESAPQSSFSSSLDRVEREQKVVAVPHGSSEKYRYVASLAAQGINAEGIAAALQMAPAEVEQLLQLSRLKQQVAG